MNECAPLKLPLEFTAEKHGDSFIAVPSTIWLRHEPPPPVKAVFLHQVFVGRFHAAILTIFPLAGAGESCQKAAASDAFTSPL